jgi:hypothetical protein
MRLRQPSITTTIEYTLTMKASVLILLLVGSHAYGACILPEGTGSDFAKIGITTRATIGPVPASVDVLYQNGLVSEIVTSNQNCTTTRGIAVGNTVKQVEKAYGRGKKTTLYLQKGGLQNGKPDLAAKLGDYVLEYPGAAFAIDKEKVWAISIRPSPR